MKTLPKYFVIKCDQKNPLWGKYIEWLNKTYGAQWEGNSECFYGYDGNKSDSGTTYWSNVHSFSNSPTVLTLEEWNEIVNGKDMSNTQFVIVTGAGQSYTTHDKAKAYGCTNYHYWKGIDSARNGDILEIVKEITINDSEPGYILKDKKGIEYIIAKAGVEPYNDINMETERKIIGYKAPYDLFGGNIKANTVYKPVASKNNIVYAATIDGKVVDGGRTNLPKEIVETWEAIYEEEKKYKIGDWVITKGYYKEYDGIPLRINKINDSDCCYFDNPDNPNYNFGLCHIKDLAKEKEIENYLIEEAKRRGFKIGIKFFNIERPSIIQSLSKFDFRYYLDGDSLYGYAPIEEWGKGNSNPSIYKNGVWAEIVPNIPDISVNGCKAEFFDYYVKFGCAKIDKDLFIGLHNIVYMDGTEYKQLTKVTIGKGEFTIEQIKQIVEHYNNK